MAKLKRRSISRSTIEAMKVDRDTVFWDRDQPGFGVRIYASGTKMYIAQARHGGESIRVTLGRHGVITADEARSRASRVLNRIRAGEEAIDAPLPVKTGDGSTVADLAERYMEQHVSAHCRESTVVSIRKLLDRYVLPEFGRVQLMALNRDRVAAFHVRRSGTPSAANQVVALIARMYRQASDWGMVPDGTNPSRGIEKHREGKRERFLTDTEFRRLGKVLSEAEVKGGASVHAAAAIRLLMLTGCRKNEILTLKWEMVDLDAGELRLPDTKTGPRTVPLSPPAVRVLAEVPRIEGNPWVIPGKKAGTHMVDLNTSWRFVRQQAGLREVRLHDCRHSFASRALALGESLPAIGKLLGHSHIRTTERYAHLARDSVRASAARVAASIAADFLG